MIGLAFVQYEDSGVVYKDPCALDCEALTKTAIQRHARLILRFWQDQIQLFWRRFLASPDGAALIDNGVFLLAKE